jgi:hypothetical protein
MNPEVKALIERALSNDIPMDAFLARMSQLGITVNEAQTMLSNAAGGSPQGMDPSLGEYRSESLSEPDAAAVQRNMSIDPRSGQMPEPGYPRHSRPMTQEEIVLARPVEERQPVIPRLVDRARELVGDARRSLTQEGEPNPQVYYGSPSTGGAAAGSQIAQTPGMATPAPTPNAAPVAPNAAPMPSINLMEDRADRARLADLPNDFGSPMGGMEYPSQLPGNLSPATVQQAINVAKRRAADTTVATGQETRAQPSAPSDSAFSFLRGRFGEAAKGSPMEDRLTAAQEARDLSGGGMAKGGVVGGGKDAALHKALEIIHHLIRTR